MRMFQRTWALLALVFFVAACAARPEIRNIEDGIAVTSADIKSVAEQVTRMCGNTVPDGPCTAGSLISTDDKQDIKARLQEASEQVVLANAAVNVRDTFEASDKLGQAEGILRLIREQLASMQGDE